ncbi:unnamed protein product [Calypogeia fissa]
MASLSSVALAGLMTFLLGCLDMKAIILGKYHYVLYYLVMAMQPQMLPLANPLSVQIVDMEFVLHGESAWLYLVSVLEVPSMVHLGSKLSGHGVRPDWCIPLRILDVCCSGSSIYGPPVEQSHLLSTEICCGWYTFDT